MKRKSRSAPETTRDELLDAAQHVFAERGFDAASLREITDRIGVANGLVRHHFGSKDGLWRAVLDRAADRYEAAVSPYAARAAGDLDVREESRAAVRSFLEVNARHPDLLRLLLHESVRGGERLDYLLGRYAPIKALMAPLFERAQQAGYLRQFDQAGFLLFLLTAGAMPFALPALAAGIFGCSLSTETEMTQQHIARILDTLYGREP